MDNVFWRDMQDEWQPLEGGDFAGVFAAPMLGETEYIAAAYCRGPINGELLFLLGVFRTREAASACALAYEEQERERLAEARRNADRICAEEFGKPIRRGWFARLRDLV